MPAKERFPKATNKLGPPRLPYNHPIIYSVYLNKKVLSASFQLHTEKKEKTKIK